MTQQQTMSNAAWAQLFLLGLIWGGSFFSIAIALREIGFLTSVVHRVGWAALVLIAVVAIRRHALPRGWQVWVGFLGMGLLNNVIPFTLMAWGQTQIETGLVSILNAATAIFGVLAAALFLRDERLTVPRGIGTVLGFAGVATIIGWSALASFDIRSIAQLAVIGGTISYALAGVWARVMLKGLPPEVAAAGMLSASFVVMLPLAWAVEGPPSLALQPATWGAIGYYAIVATAGAYLLYYRILAIAGSGNLLLVTLVIPAVAISLGAAFLGESLPASAFAGLALIAAGLIVIDGRVHRALFKRTASG
ncbi:DMT family transporter [Pontivivens ytuae]|uniref:DMT family transporter n=1 Tax=Pontivivens ytuae TaxID=2789856 RepID=A0A7S9QCY9_9RHOB|nr:DMT family transporter [Pontivivens ytuae]QPH53842.1 DMT family transporter [Pontivivens ytuae]